MKCEASPKVFYNARQGSYVMGPLSYTLKKGGLFCALVSDVVSDRIQYD